MARLLALLAVLLPLVAGQQFSTKRYCLTAYGTTKGPVRTVTVASNTFTVHRKIKVTSTPSIVVTPPAVTETSTSTSISTTTIQDVVTNTVTNTQVEKTTVTESTETFTTTTSSTTTTLAATVSTIPVPSGFIYPSPTPPASRKRNAGGAVRGGAVAKRGKLKTPKPVKGKSSHHCNLANKYPVEVFCYALIKEVEVRTKTITASPTTTTARPSTITERTSTIVVETTRPPASTSVTTTTSTLLQTETTTSVSTGTVTEHVTATETPPPSSTYIAACGPANQVSTDYQGRKLELEASYVSASDFYTEDAYSCCVACFTTPGCYGSTWGAGFGAQSCELNINSNSCPANQGGIGGLYSWARPGSISLTVSNGPCGKFDYSESGR